MGSNYQNIFYKDYEREVEQNKKLKGENRELKYENKLLTQRNETQAQQILELTTQYKKQLEEQAKLIKEQQKELERLKSQLNSNETNSGLSAGAAALNENLNAEQQKEIAHLKSLLNTDGTNSGTPTSKTPPNKNKKIPNTREKTDTHRGGQKKHPKHKLKRFKDAEVTKQVEHPLEECPKCHNELKGPVKKTIEKDVLDIEVLINKIRHLFHVYYCPRCRKLVHETIPNELKEENQYGPNVQTLALVLMIIGHVSMNKVKKIIKGLSRGEINVSEGFLVKLQRRASGRLKGFIAGLRNLILQQALLFWDDTVIMIDKARACLRFYGTELLALYKAHTHKDKAGLDKDNILNLLPDTTIVVHDHNKVNYNEDYSFQNAECNVHLIRDLQRVIDNRNAQWATFLIALLVETNNARKKRKEAGEKGFTAAFLRDFFEQFSHILSAALLENAAAGDVYYAHEEQILIKRILEYQNEYLLWVIDFDVPFSNNLSERSLRDLKSKMKISGQFNNIETAGYYADIKSYIETCYRNDVNGFYALHCLCIGNPITLTELLPLPSLRL